MHIKTMILEGFKSYGQRTEVSGFDKEFNAITGLNGSGKSNILDAICFVLGISNLGQVRAGSLQDLVYKSGQAGIVKASVTIKFDNKDTSSSPLGYEQYEEITVTRQTVVGGKNKYLINGSNVTNKRVMDMFCSVQLNVNNPHFLIMQGRITKVLNMKPPEILSMIEEAAGTRMYEGKKQAAYKTIEKKDSKLRELDELMKNEIGPRLQKLKDERVQYLEYQKIQREVDHLSRIFIAWKYHCAQETSEKALSNLEAAKEKMNRRRINIKEGTAEMEAIAKKVEDLSAKLSTEMGGELEELENELKHKEKSEAQLLAKIKSHKDTINSEHKRKKQLEKSAKEDQVLLAQKEAEMSNSGGVFTALKEAEAADAEALAAAERKYEAVSAGLLSNDDGESATLQEQLMAAKSVVSTANTEIKQCQMELAHNRAELASKEKELSSSDRGYKQDAATMEKMEKEVANMASELKRIQYEDGAMERLEEQQHQLSAAIRSAQHKAEGLEYRYPSLTFKYKDPKPNFDRQKVKGLVCRMFRVKDPKYTRALESAGGGRLYFIVVDNEETSKLLLTHGELQRRVTVIPLNRISGRAMDARTVQLAKSIAGQDNVHCALDLIEFAPELRPAMEWVFGQVLICTDGKVAQNVTFHREIMKRSVTLDGDVFDPSGTLSGGAAIQSDPILAVLEELRAAQDLLASKEHELQEVQAKIRATSKDAERFNTLKQRHALRSHEAELLRGRLEKTDHHQLMVDVKNLKQSIEDLTKKIDTAKESIKEGERKAKVIEAKMKDFTKIRDQELKAAEDEMKRLKKKSEESRNKWKKREQEFETMNLEIQELHSSVEATQKQIEELVENLNTLENESKEMEEKLAEQKSSVKDLVLQVKSKKEEITTHNKEIQTAQKKSDQIKKSIGEWELEIKKLDHECQKIADDSKDCQKMINELTRKYDWIEADKQYFNRAGGVYDFQENEPNKIGKRLAKLEETKEKLGRTVNARAMNLLSKEEEQYTDVLRRKVIVENDKSQIMEVIRELDEKKKKALQKAWAQVNKDFGSIFSTLLPGSSAKLMPPQGQTVLDGLEVKVGFGDIWKESLNELSGGQRSLVALSLILAMLLFKPAPIYILDEVDAALDLSHTQNIGAMLKKHFTHSQFIVVSLKDGMFNNANVLYRTKFVDGMSTVTRIVQNFSAQEEQNRQQQQTKQQLNRKTNGPMRLW